jgi:MYXO-CTERM domain-containing protein
MAPAGLLCLCVGLLSAASPARADIDPNSGIDFVRVGAVGNAAWTGGGIYVNNRGRVDYEYSIGKFEVTTTQWAEFMNAAFDRPANDRIPFVWSPTQWSAQSTTPTVPGARRWNVPAGREMLPVGGVDWRTCAIYANWLHNDKATNREAFLSGAYEVSTFGYLNGGSLFTDQLTRSLGARYWIPSLDEWMKAAHYDPNKQNTDGSVGGWWAYANGSDTPFVYGPPGVRSRATTPPFGGFGPDPTGPFATANAGWDIFHFPGYNPYVVPLGAYNVISPWGMYDAAGGTKEWTEAAVGDFGDPLPQNRHYEGSGWASGTGGDLLRSVGGSEYPSFPLSEVGLRIASNVPAPGFGSLGVVLIGVSLGRRRRRNHDRTENDSILGGGGTGKPGVRGDDRVGSDPANGFPGSGHRELAQSWLISPKLPCRSRIVWHVWGMRGSIQRRLVLAPMVLALAYFAPPALADVDPNSGIDFVRVGAVGNAAYTGGGLYVNNRGRVDYEYSIGKFEVTTTQWAEFMNAAFDRPADDRIPFVWSPTQWSAQSATPNTPGARRWSVPAGREMLPVGGVDWRTCAIYANWLHNDKATTRAAFLNGAYDVSTFGYFQGGSGFTDQLTRSPGARYWIPSLDEWMKAAHYDPNKQNADGSVGGWWTYANGSDTPFVYGPPGVRSRTTLPYGPDPTGPFATANAGWDIFHFAGNNPFAVPLGSYAVTSPWGLYDAAGGISEWTEGFFQIPDEPLPRDRFYDGSGWRDTTGGDLLRSLSGGEFPSAPLSGVGLRIASNVPSPGIGSLGLVLVGMSLGRRRRRNHDRTENDSILGGRGTGKPGVRGDDRVSGVPVRSDHR